MQKVKLGEAFDLQMGKTPARNQSEYWNGKNKWVAIADINGSKYISETKEFITDKAIIESGIKPVPANTVIMSFKLSIGKVAITKEQIYTNEAIMAFIDKNTYEIDINYLYYLLGNYNWAEGCNKAVKGLTLNKATLSDIEISLPPLEEQRKIAEKLDKVSKLIDQRKEQLTNLDLLIKSQFITLFGEIDLSNQKNNYSKIGDVAEIVGGSTPKTNIEEYWNGEYFWITPAELNENSFIINSTERKLTKQGVDSCSLKLIPKNTVLLSSRAPIGKVAITGVEMYCNQGFKNIICSDKVLPIYMYYLLKYNTEYLNSLGRGATFKEISKSIVENILIPLPPIELQNKFAEFVERVDKLKSKVNNSLANLTQLKQSLMQQYFN